MRAKTVWENEAHKHYDHEQDFLYIVRARTTEWVPGTEWNIVFTSSNYERAAQEAENLTSSNPSLPVRVEAVTFTPEIA